MIFLVNKFNRVYFQKELRDLYKARYNVFVERLKWDVSAENEQEKDTFDHEETVYLIYKHPERGVCGGVRFLPTSGSYMLKDVFPYLCDDKRLLLPDENVWESSRFFIDTKRIGAHESADSKGATLELFIAMVEFGLSIGLRWILTVTDLRVERILKYSGWPLHRIGEPKQVDNTTAVAGYLEVSHHARERLREKASMDDYVLWCTMPIDFSILDPTAGLRPLQS